MKKFSHFLVPLLMVLVILGSIVWYLFVYDRDFTRDSLLGQARYQDLYGNSRLSAWFYNAAYNFSGHDENVAIELANQYKQDGNYTKAEVTLTKAIASGATAELYTALCRAYVEQDKLLDAIQLLENIPDPAIKAELDALRPVSPAPSTEPGYYSHYVDLALSSNGKYIFYSTDGSYPSVNGHHVSGSIALEAGETSVCAIAVGEDGLVSPLSTMNFTVTGVIEEVVFCDAAMEAAIRERIGAAADATVYTNQLWEIREFEAPEGVISYADLSLLPYLNQLTLDGARIDSLSHLSGLHQLSTLVMRDCRFPVEELTVLGDLPALTDLTMTGCGLSTIDDLAACRNLTRLDLCGNSLRKLDVLSDMTTLKELYLDNNAVTDLSALATLENLSTLTVNMNQVKSLSDLSSCCLLEHLEADNNKISSLTGVEKLSLLTHLSVDFNALKNVDLLAGSVQLKNLSIASNEISNIRTLHTLVNLEVFDFSGNNEITALPNWPEDCALKTIDGSYNSLESIDILGKMPSLTHVYMDYNKLKNIDALADCFCLVMVNVYGNEIPDVEALREHDIIVNYDPTVKSDSE